jgi:hypothetical protein
LVIPVRIEDVIAAVPRKGSVPSRMAGEEFTLAEKPPPAPPATVDDIVQLTLGYDGIWKVHHPAPPLENANVTSTSPSQPILPRVARLYHSFLHLYSPEGMLRAMEQSRGLMVDVYA